MDGSRAPRRTGSCSSALVLFILSISLSCVAGRAALTVVLADGALDMDECAVSARERLPLRGEV
jgi:hypothetical protein